MVQMFMKEKLKFTFSDNLIKYSIVLSILLLVGDIVVTLMFYPNLPPYIPFFNSMPWGEARLASPVAAIILCCIGIGVFSLNTVLSVLLYQKQPLLSRILSITSFLFMLLGLLATLHIIFLVF